MKAFQLFTNARNWLYQNAQGDCSVMIYTPTSGAVCIYDYKSGNRRGASARADYGLRTECPYWAEGASNY